MLDTRCSISNVSQMLKKILPFVTLFFSLSTLICCAFPALLVSLGAGAALVSILSTAPQLMWFSEHKGIVFGVAGTLLLVTGLLRRYVPASCPADPVLAEAGGKAQRANTWVYRGSVVIFCVGAFFAFVAPLLLA